MARSSRPLKRPGRTPATTNLLAALAVIVVILPLLLNAATSAPPTAAEFAPSAQQIIKKAPQAQAAAVNGTGQGAGKGSGGVLTKKPAAIPPSVAPSPSPSPPPTTAPASEVPANLVKKCVGPPPLRQIEDPQSPPCIAYWQGNNGGATAQGVTKDSIYIAIPTPDNATSKYQALQNFFNNRFQFYGRKLVFEFCSSSGGGSGSSDQPTQVADAALAAAGCGGPPPFASQFYRTENGAYYMPEMGCRYKVITVGVYSPYDSSFMNKCEPYLYQYPMEVDDELANLGEWACGRLAGMKAAYAAGSDGLVPPQNMVDKTRRFGILLDPFTDDDPVLHRSALDPLVNRLKACGADAPDKDVILNPVTGDFDATTANNAISQLKSDGVTSIFCLCNFFSLGTLQRAATTNAWQPEWITSTFGLSDVDSSFTLAASTSDQLSHTFGITFQPRIIPPLENPYNVAVQEGDPTVGTDTTATVESELEVYRGLLLLASGIQMAGPHLTVQSFHDGLVKTQFPNPITSTHAGAVGFANDHWSMTDDAAEWWYGATSKGPFSDSNGAQGTVCYLDGGARHTLGSWPKGPAPFFQGACDG